MSSSLHVPAGNSSNVRISVEDYPPGTYNLTVIVVDINNQTRSVLLETLRLSGLIHACNKVCL